MRLFSQFQPPSPCLTPTGLLLHATGASISFLIREVVCISFAIHIRCIHSLTYKHCSYIHRIHMLIQHICSICLYIVLRGSVIPTLGYIFHYTSSFLIYLFLNIHSVKTLLLFLITYLYYLSIYFQFYLFITRRGLYKGGHIENELK